MTTASRTRLWLALAAIACPVTLSGCRQADYAADLTNHTPQPIRALIFLKGRDSTVLGTARRLGPGDRVYLGPVRNAEDYGAFLSIESAGNPGRPVTLDLREGLTYFEIRQEGEGPESPLRLVEKR